MRSFPVRPSRCALSAGLVLLALQLALPAVAQEAKDRGELLDGIIATVGDQVVTRSELAQAIAFPAALLKAKAEAGMPDAEVSEAFAALQQETRDNLVNNQLILMAAKAEGVSMADEVRRRMQKLRSGFQNDRARLEEFLAAQGFSSIEEYERQMEEELLRQRMVFGHVRPRAELSDKELEAGFVERYAGKKAQEKQCEGALIRYHEVEQLHFPTPANISMKDAMSAYAGAYRCYLQLRAGTIAMGQAPAICVAAETAPTYGTLGEVDETKSFERSFQEAFDGLAADPTAHFSEPFISKDGIRILRTVSSREGCVTDTEEIGHLKDRVRARLEDEKFEKLLEWWLQELRGKFRVEVKSL
jgi:hypothetical protein